MRRIRLGAAGALVAGIGLVSWATAAWATTPTLTASPSTGLSPGQTVTLSGSGYTATSFGNFLECNNAPNEPTVHLGGLVNSDVAVGCTGPSGSGNAFTQTSSAGALSKSYQLASSTTVGPPCGAGDLVTTCPATDSTGQSTAADAAKYPCPPTAAQQAAGVTCVINFGDQANDSSSVNILFQGETTGAATTTTAATTATTAGTTATTAGTTATTAASSTSSGSSTALANTGPGPALWVLALAGLGLILAAVGLEVSVRRGWAGTRGPPSA